MIIITMYKCLCTENQDMFTLRIQLPAKIMSECH